MTNCTTRQNTFPSPSPSPSLFSDVKRRKIDVNFEGGDISSDGGVLLLREVDHRLGLLDDVAAGFSDTRDPDRIKHSVRSILAQRVYGISLGYEDLNDHDSLRNDIAFQSAVGCDENLGSSPTLCRFENMANREFAVHAHKVLVEQFISSFSSAPSELVLDFDATDDRIHGEQEQKFYHGYYRTYCFLPLYVFCGEQLLVAYLRPSDIDGSKHAGAILRLLVTRLREEWPQVRIIFRGDSHFCRKRILYWCENNNVEYVVGIGSNSVLKGRASSFVEQAQQEYQATQEKQRIFGDFRYAAGSWNKIERRIIVKAEHTDFGENTRFIACNLTGDAQDIYDKIYCARGDMENRIKEQQLGLFADRTSAHIWWANQFRLLLSSLAYVLIESIRRLALTGTELAKAQVGTIRLKLFKIGVVLIRNTRRIKFLLSSSYCYKDLFCSSAKRLRAKPG